MTLQETMRAELKSARDIAAKYDGDIPADDLALVTQHLKAFEAAKAQFEKGKESEAVKASLAAIGFDLGLERTSDERQKADEFIVPPRGKSLGTMFTEGAEYQAFMKDFSGGRIPDKARIQSAPMGVKSLFTGLSDTSAGAFVTTDRQPDFELLGRRPLTLRDLVSKRTTGSDTVDFVKQTSQLTAADVVAEATTSALPTTGASSGAALTQAAGGGYKPEGTFAFSVVTTTVKTIAEWVAATKRSLADAAQLRGLIDQELRDDLAETEEDEILNGSGSGEHLTGILNTSGIQAQGYSATVSGVHPSIETALKGRTKVRTVGRAIPTAYLFNPADWETIDLARIGRNPANEATGLSQPTLNGLPVVQSEAIAAGVGLVGDFRKAVIWDREQANISATDSHADFFIRNLVAILGEERLAFGVTRPSAFVTLDLTA